MSAARGQATGSVRPQLCFDGGNKPSGNPASLSDEQQQAATPCDIMHQHSAKPDLETVTNEQLENVEEVQESAIDIHGPQADLDCKFCSTIVDFFNAVYSPGRRQSIRSIFLGDTPDLLSSNCSHRTLLQHLVYSGQGVKVAGHELGAVRLCQGFAQRTEATLRAEYQTESAWGTTPSPPFELIFRPEVPDHRGRGRILDQNWIDIELIKSWRSRCIAEHGGSCDKRVFMSVAPFRPWWLIDVVQECVVPCEDEEPRFLTISYTWGKTKNFLTTKQNINDVRRPGSLLSDSVFANIPTTIRNTIALTKALGETRLWVDSLCIAQDDQAALQHHLGNMHRVYASSFLTIIAEDGQDAEFGLRGLWGVSPARVADHEILPLAAGERLLMTGSRFRQRQPSIYNYDQRMWTFQEWSFAKRRLTFTSLGCVKWECNCAEWEEHLRYHADGEISMDTEISAGFKSRIPSLHTVMGIVREFNEKNLTYDEDVLRAFSGIQTHFNGIFPSGLIFGHPELFFDISLCWSTWDNLRRRTLSERFSGDPMRDGLPSWSWMGWQGKTLVPTDAEHQPGDFGFTEPVTKWYCAESASSASPRPLDTRWHEFRAAAAERQVEMDGWSSSKFEPPRWWSGPSAHGLHCVPWRMPKQLPRHIYHCKGLENTGLREACWYPVPLMSEDVRPAEGRPDRPQQCQFIRCETTRAFLTGSTEYSQETLQESCLNPIQPLKDDGGNTVGALILHHREDHSLFKGGRKVELVAIVKGWIGALSRFHWGPGESHSSADVQDDVAEDSSVEINEDGAHGSRLIASEEGDEEMCLSPRSYNSAERDEYVVDDDEEGHEPGPSAPEEKDKGDSSPSSGFISAENYEDVVDESDISASEENDKGFPPSPRSYLPVEDAEDVASESNRTASVEEDRDAGSYDSNEGYRVPWILEWELQRQNKLDCVFVLWIVRDHGIAYRKAFGYVLAEKWEELKEPESIDLILG